MQFSLESIADVLEYVDWMRQQKQVVLQTEIDRFFGFTDDSGYQRGLLVNLIHCKEPDQGHWPWLLEDEYILRNARYGIAMDVLAMLAKHQKVGLQHWAEKKCLEITRGARPGMTLGAISAAEEAHRVGQQEGGKRCAKAGAGLLCSPAAGEK